MSQRRKEQFDYHQFRQLLKTSLKLDIRSSQGMQYGSSSSRIPQVFGVLMFYFMVSIGLSVSIYMIPSIFTGTLIITAVVMAFVALNILIEFGSIILSPDDFEILSPLPISSRTVFYSKMANLLIYSAAITLSLIIIPTVTLAARTGETIATLMFFIAEMFAGITVSMIIALVYSTLLKLISAERLSAVLSYAQMLLGFTVWFGYMITSRVFGKSVLSVGELTQWWVFILPPAWYASLMGIAGAVESGNWVWSAMLGIVGTVLAVLIGAKYLSVSYAASLSRSVSVSSQTKSRGQSAPVGGSGAWRRWLKPEDLCVFRLIWSHFKYDNKFKMTVLSLLPLSAMYFFLAGSEGIVDPFAGSFNDSGAFMIFIPLGILPIMILASLIYSTSYKASWVFFATPANLADIVLAGLKFVHFAFVIPYAIIYAIVLGFFYGSFVHSLLFTTILYLLVAILLRITYAFLGKVPFSIPPKKGQQSSLFVMMLFVMPVFIISAILLMFLVSRSNPFIAVPTIFTVLLILNWISALFCRRKIRIKAIHLRYSD